MHAESATMALEKKNSSGFKDIFDNHPCTGRMFANSSFEPNKLTPFQALLSVRVAVGGRSDRERTPLLCHLYDHPGIQHLAD